MTDKIKTGIDLAALAALQKPRTPEQEEHYRMVTERNERMQRIGIPQPKSGTWGKPPK